MSEAEKRVSDLLDRWLASLELHACYVKLDDTEYAKVQAWPKHQRPNKWIIDLARQRVGELKHHLQERRELGDDEFADALELMGFLTSLLATEHLERFVPMAVPQKDGTARQPSLKPDTGTPSTTRARTPPAGRSTATRTPPRPAAVRPISPRPPAPAARRASSAVAAQKSPATRGATARPVATRQAAPTPRPAARPAKLPEYVVRIVIDDAVRLLDWGREWPQLAGLIARLADRPPEKEIWGVLSEHRSTIEARAKPRSE